MAIEYRFAEGHYDRLSGLAADLVRRSVNVLVATGGTASAIAAKPIMPATVPLVFAMGGETHNGHRPSSVRGQRLDPPRLDNV